MNANDLYKERLRIDLGVLGAAAWRAYTAYSGKGGAVDMSTWEFVAMAVVAELVRTHRLVPEERCNGSAKPST